MKRIEQDSPVKSLYLIIFTTALFIVVKDVVSDISVLQQRLLLDALSSSCKQQQQQHKH